MRQREDFKEGTLGANLLTTVTTIDFGSDPGFATIAAPDYATIVIDPEGAGNGPEIVYLTAFTATQTTGTITRGKEGTADPGLTHAAGAAWSHGPTIEDYNRFVWAWDSADPSGAAQVDIDLAGFEAVQIIGWMKPANDNVTTLMLFSNDGGSSFRTGGADYRWGFHYVSLSSIRGALGSTGAAAITLSVSQGADATERISFNITIIAPGDANVFTSYAGEVVHQNFNAATLIGRVGGEVRTEEVNDFLRLAFSAGNIASGRIAVYGFPTP